MKDQLEGYVYLNQEEEEQAQNWWKQHGHEIPDMEDGENVFGSPLIYGLQEDPDTGRLIVPKDGQLQSNAYGEILHKLPEKEQKILEYVARGMSQREIAKRMKISQSTIHRLINRITENLKMLKRESMM